MQFVVLSRRLCAARVQVVGQILQVDTFCGFLRLGQPHDRKVNLTGQYFAQQLVDGQWAEVVLADLCNRHNTTGWRFSLCGRKVTNPSRAISFKAAIAAQSTPVALVSSQMPTTSRIAPTATVRPNWPQVARPVWISE